MQQNKKTKNCKLLFEGFIKLLLDIIRTHVSALKSIRAENEKKTAKQVKILHMEKIALKNRKSIQTPIFHFTSKAV